MIRNILIYISIFIGLFAVSYYFLSFILDKRIRKKFSEKDLPATTIVIPAYNEERAIKETIISALKLDYPKEKLEIFVVVNGSKDRTYEIAKTVKDKRLKIFNLKEAGKANAVNFGLARAKGKIVVTMDADSTAEPNALKEMVSYFANPEVACVAPAMTIHDPKGILQRVQQIEYFLGIYLRKAFSSMDAIHVTPGAFSAYRKSFFDKYGGFQVGNITEDMEVSLRIQYNHFKIEFADKAIVYTKSPNTFLSLLRQRRRWYFGLTKNLWNYRKLFSKQYGEMGMIVLPVAVTSIFFSTILTTWMFIDTLINVRKELMLFKSINFNFSNFFKTNQFVFERFFFNIFSNPIFIFLILFTLILLAYMFFAKSKVVKYSNIKLSLPLFMILFSVLFALWWLVSLFYVIFVGRISWGRQ